MDKSFQTSYKEPSEVVVVQVLSQITGRPLDVIRLRDLAVQCVIGIHPEEKIRPQSLRLDVSLYLDTVPAGMSGILSRTVDYSLVAKQLNFILTYSRFRLLESAAEALAIFLLTPPRGEHPTIHAVDIEIKKPEALGGVAEPSVRIFRDLENRHLWVKRGAASRILFQVPEAQFERCHIQPGEALTLDSSEDHALMTESTGLVVEGSIQGPGVILPFGKELTITNIDAEAKSFLAVSFRGRERSSTAAPTLHS